MNTIVHQHDRTQYPAPDLAASVLPIPNHMTRVTSSMQGNR
jgi:hypothetical protein